LIPRPKVHHRLREEHADIRIVWMFLPHRAHRVRISAVERAAVFGLRIRIPVAERLNEFAFDG
jgi:hypothetical protein